jgi:LacI family transcriptional regulator
VVAIDGKRGDPGCAGVAIDGTAGSILGRRPVADRSILRDVATVAGVSLRTASRVLNDDPRVAASTRERVRDVMRELRYTPDLMARSLRAGTDATIGLVVESIADPFFAQLVAAVEDAGSEQGRSVLVASTHGDDDRESRVIGDLLRRRVSGLLVVPTPGDHSWLADAGAPLVLVDRPGAGLDADLVGIDDHGAAYEAVSHLIRHGHREIAYIGDSAEVPTSAARLAGYRQALADHDLHVPRELVHADCRTAEAAAAAMRSVLTQGRPPTAVFSAATRCSLGVVPAMHREGRTGLALVGFGDFAMADALVPAVTVVNHHGAAVGRAAAARLLQRIADPELAPQTVHVPVSLLQRGSGEIAP